MRVALSFWLPFVLLLACTPRQAEFTRTPVLLVAADGLEWNVLLPLLQQGRLPTFARLLAQGRAGWIETFRPTFSPVLWTTVATGKPPSEHGIENFVVRRGGRIVRLYNSYDRKTKAFWNILTDYGVPCAVIGWWMTYPAEPIAGVMVSQVNTLDQAFGGQGRAIAKGRLWPGLEKQVYPPELATRVVQVHERVARELPGRIRTIFGQFRHQPGSLEKRLLVNTLWALRSDATYVEVTLDLLSEPSADYRLVALYLGGPDVVGHRFWRYREPDAFVDPPSPEMIDDYGHMIDDYYVYVDRVIGRVWTQLGTATVMVVSDHGMHAENTTQRFDQSELPVNVNSGGHEDAPPGVFVLSGPRVAQPFVGTARRLERGELRRLASLYDVAPTLLALLGLPAGEDMPGRVLTELIDLRPDAIRRVRSHDDPAWRQARARLDPEAAQRRAEEVRLDQLRALGYIQ